MNLENRVALLFLAEESRNLLRAARIEAGADFALEAAIIESEDLGLWIRVFRDGNERCFLLRWEYLLAVDLQLVDAKPFGLSSGKRLG